MERKDVFLSISRPGFNVRLWGYLAGISVGVFSLFSLSGLKEG